MALNEYEQKLYADIVKVVNRTDKPLEFLWDSKLYVIEPGRKGKQMPRFIGEHGASKHPVSFDANGFPIGSLLGIEGDDNFPTDKLSPEEVKQIEESDKFGADVVFNGALVTKKRVELKQPKENFAVNNLG